MKVFTRTAFVLLLGVAPAGAGCAKGHGPAGVTGAALTTNQIDDDKDNKIDEADEARCTCNDDGKGDDHQGDGAVADKDNEVGESAKADGGAHHHECECGDGDHQDGGHQGGDHQDGDHQNSDGQNEDSPGGK